MFGLQWHGISIYHIHPESNFGRPSCLLLFNRTLAGGPSGGPWQPLGGSWGFDLPKVDMFLEKKLLSSPFFDAKHQCEKGPEFDV